MSLLPCPAISGQNLVETDLLWNKSGVCYILLKPKKLLLGTKWGHDLIPISSSSLSSRYYYKREILERVDGRRLVYKFGRNAKGWRESDKWQFWWINYNIIVNIVCVWYFPPLWHFFVVSKARLNHLLHCFDLKAFGFLGLFLMKNHQRRPSANVNCCVGACFESDVFFKLVNVPTHVLRSHPCV